MSQITTHVLDTSKGAPAKGITIILQEFSNDNWQEIGSGITNADGRLSKLLAQDKLLEKGSYRLTFKLEAYFEAQNKDVFYPEATVEFKVSDHSHYHIPLLLSPYGYSTYRGS